MAEGIIWHSLFKLLSLDKGKKTTLIDTDNTTANRVQHNLS